MIPSNFNSKKIWEEDRRAAGPSPKKKTPASGAAPSSKKKIPTPNIHSKQPVPSSKKITKATPLENVHKNITVQMATTEPQKPCLPEAGELDKLSQSPKGFRWDPEKSEINERILFHIHGDEFGQGSELEGMNSTAVLNYIHSFFEKQGSYGLDPDKKKEVLAQLKAAEKLAQSSNFAKDARQALEDAAKTKKPVFMVGGWAGNPLGHTIYYEITPDTVPSDSKQTASIRFYQLGLGSDEHLGVIIGNKIKRKPYYELSNVSYDRLLNSSFLEAIHEMQTFLEVPGTGESTDYTPQDIYRGLQALVGGDPVISDSEEEVISMSTQRAGTCPFRSLMAWMKIQLGDQYKIFKCDLQLKSLVDSVYGDTRPTNEISLREWNLVNKSLEKFSRHLDRAYENGIIGKEYLRDAHILLKPVNMWVKRHKNILYRDKVEEAAKIAADFKYTPVQGKAISPLLHAPLSKASATNKTSHLISPTCHHFVEKFQSIRFDKREILKEDLKSVIELMDQAIQAHEHIALEESMIQLMKKLPIDFEFWKTKDEKEAKELILLLGEISKRFFQNCFMTTDGMAKIELIYVLAKLAHLQSQRLLPKTFKNLPFEWEDVLIFNDLFFGISDTQIQKDFARIKKFSSHNDLKFNYYKEKLSIIFYSSAHAFLIKDYLKKEDPSAWQKIVDQIPNYENMSSSELNAHFYASPYLPEWMRLLIDTSIQVSYLVHEPVGHVKSVNFAFDIKKTPFGSDKEKALFIKLKETPINQTKVDEKNRYRSLYRPLGALQGLFKERNTKGYDTESYEKELLTRNASELSLDMPDDDYHELDHIRGHEYLLVHETIDYFSRHPAKLHESEYQALLQIFLFQARELPDAITNGYGPKLSSFVSSHFFLFKNKGDYATASFMLMLARKCRNFIPDDPFFKTSLDHARQLLSTAKDPYVRSLLYRELAAGLAEQEQLNENEVKELLEATIYLQSSPISDKWADPSSDTAVRRALIKHSHHIQKALVDRGNVNQSLLNAVLQALRPHEQKKTWIVEEKPGKFPLFYSEDRSYSLSPLEAKLFHQQQPEMVFPFEITSNPLFTQLFSGIQKGYPRGEAYAFKDQRGYETLVKFDTQTQRLILEQKREEGWCRLIPKEDLLESKESKITSAFFNRTLAQDYDSWQLIDDPRRVFICERKDQKVLYQAQYKENGEIQSITRTADQAVLGIPSAHFVNFEDPAYTQNWYEQSGNLKEIVLPRFGLTFAPDPDEPATLVSKEFSDYRLVVGQPVNALGGFSNYLFLKKGDQKKLLIPKQEFLSPDLKFEVLEFHHNIDKNLEATDTNKQSFAVYDVTTDVLGEDWTCNTEEDRLFFATVQAVVQKYKEAAATLRKTGEKRGPYTENETKILQKLIDLDAVTADNSGNSICLRALGGYLLTRNSLNYNYPLSAKIKDKIRENYLEYLDHYRQITIPRLKSYEELLLLKQMIAEEWDPILFNRLQELDPAAASRVPFRKDKEGLKLELTGGLLEKKETMGSESFKNLLEGSTASSYHSFRQLQSKERMITRPYEHIKKNFSYYVNVALKGRKEELAWLKDAIDFALAAKTDETPNELDFLNLVLKHPNKFVALDDSIYVEEWVNESLKQIAQLDLSQEVTSSKPQTIEKTPANFALNSKSHIQEVATPVFNYISLDPLLENPSQFFIPIEGHGDPLKKELASQSDWFAEQAALVNDQPLFQELTRLKIDTDNFAEKPVLPQYSLNGDFQSTLNELEIKLNADKEDAAAELENLKNEIVGLANSEPTELDEMARKEIQLLGGRLRPIALADVLISFAKGDANFLMRLNPHLNANQLHTIFQKAGNFLELATYEQQRERSLDALEELKNVKDTDSQRREDLLQDLAAQCTVKRAYVSQKHPAYLAFEYYSNLLMRKDQCEKLEVFLKEGDLNPIIEMIMGSGKSKVLLPLLALLRADGKTISTLIVPEALLESVASDTEQVLLRGFGQELHYLHFDRNTVFTSHSLEVILEELKNIQNSEECLIMTPGSLQSLILKFIEANIKDSLKGTKSISPMVSQMREILSLLGTDTQAIIDEADSVLSVLTQMCYGIGDQSELEEWEIALISELFGILYEDPAIRELAKLESDPSPNPEAPVLSPALYVNKVQRSLAEAFLERLKTVKFNPEEKSLRVRQFFSDLKDKDRDLALNYLCQFQEHRPEAQKYFDKQNPAIQDILALAGAEISGFLSHTLSQTANENYGLHQPEKSSLPIPFGAVTKPKVGSQFANEYVTANYTFQIYRKQKVPKELVIAQVKKIQEQIAAELLELGSEHDMKNTKGWKTFEHLKGKCDFPLDEYTDQHVEDLINDINQDPIRLREFISYVIMPQLKLHHQMLSCNAHNLVAFLSKPSGFTGTLHNSKSMHRNLNMQPAKGIDAKTIHILRKNSYTDVAVIKEGDTQSMIQQMENKGIDWRMITDTGGYFKEGSNAALARTMALQKGMPVVFYNADGKQMITDGVNESLLKNSKILPGKRLTFIDQSHTTGADVKQDPYARSVLTIGKNTTLRDLAQSAWRLRSLDKSQKISFVLTEEMEKLIRQTLKMKSGETINFDHILLFVVKNQSQRQGKDNFTGLCMELKSIPQILLLKALMDLKLSQEEFINVQNLLKGQWLQSGRPPPRTRFGQIPEVKQMEEIVAQEKKQTLDTLEMLYKACPALEKISNLEKSKKAVDEVIKKVEGYLAKEMLTGKKDEDKTMEIERESEKAEETEIELESQHTVKSDKMTLGEKMFVHGKYTVCNLDTFNFSSKEAPPIFSLKDFFSQDPALAPYEDAFSDLYVSLNHLQWPKDHPTVKDLKLFGPLRTPVYYVGVDKEENRIFLVSQKEMFFNDSAHYFHIRQGPIYCRDRQLFSVGVKEFKEEYPQLDSLFKNELFGRITKAKFLAGESSFTKEEQAFLRSWFETYGAQKLKTFYFDHVLKDNPSKKADYYAKGNLKRVFDDLTRKVA